MSDDSKKRENSTNKLDRREFIGAAAATAGVMFIKPSLVRGTCGQFSRARWFAGLRRTRHGRCDEHDRHRRGAGGCAGGHVPGPA